MPLQFASDTSTVRRNLYTYDKRPSDFCTTHIQQWCYVLHKLRMDGSLELSYKNRTKTVICISLFIVFFNGASFIVRTTMLWVCAPRAWNSRLVEEQNRGLRGLMHRVVSHWQACCARKAPVRYLECLKGAEQKNFSEGARPTLRCPTSHMRTLNSELWLSVLPYQLWPQTTEYFLLVGGIPQNVSPLTKKHGFFLVQCFFPSSLMNRHHSCSLR
jgi:hypothetical protein